jgi:hypothetical protein
MKDIQSDNTDSDNVMIEASDILADFKRRGWYRTGPGTETGTGTGVQTSRGEGEKDANPLY